MKEMETLQFVLDLFKRKTWVCFNDIKDEYNKTHYPYIDVELIKIILDKLRDEEYIKPLNNDHDEIIEDTKFINPDVAKIIQYKLTFKGRTFVGFTTSNKFSYKLKEWIKEPDNAWKIFTFFVSPILSFFLGLWLGHHFK